MEEEPNSLDGADGVVNPGVSNANNVEVGDPIDQANDDDSEVSNNNNAASSTNSSRQQRVAPGSSAPRDEESIRYRVLNESRRGKPVRSTCPLWKFFMVYTSESLSGIAVCKLCEANGDLGDAEVRYSSPTHLRQHLDTKKREGHREALKYHEEEAVAAGGAKGSGISDSSSSGVAAGGKGAGAAIAFMDDVKPFTRKIARFIIDTHQPLSVSGVWWCGMNIHKAVGLGPGPGCIGITTGIVLGTSTTAAAVPPEGSASFTSVYVPSSSITAKLQIVTSFKKQPALPVIF